MAGNGKRYTDEPILPILNEAAAPGRSGSGPPREPGSHDREPLHSGCSVNSRSQCLKVVDRFRSAGARPRSHKRLQGPPQAGR